MIQLTRLNKQPLVVNSDMIKLIENAPDTVITLLNGEKIVVLETSAQIIDLIVAFRRRVLNALQMNFTGWNPPAEELPKVNDPEAKSEES
jgi:uncharacterized protein YlzI (FlbEa/FlbD family)